MELINGVLESVDSWFFSISNSYPSKRQPPPNVWEAVERLIKRINQRVVFSDGDDR